MLDNNLPKTRDLIEYNEFLYQSPSARLLYYDLLMCVDEKGFVRPEEVMSLTHASIDDLLELLSDGYVIPSTSGGLFVTYINRKSIYRCLNLITRKEYIKLPNAITPVKREESSKNKILLFQRESRNKAI